MRLGFHGATTMTSDLETDIAVSAAAGFTALELWAAKVDTYLAKHTPSDLKTLLDNNGISPLTFNSVEFIAWRGNEYSTIQERTKELCRIGQAIGCPTIIVVPSPDPSIEQKWPDTVAEYVKVLRDLSDIAAPYKMKLAFELLGFGWCSVRTPRAAWEIVRKTGRANVGMVYDAAHVFGGGGLMNELDEIDPERIFAFHLDDIEDTAKEAITDDTRLMPGWGILPLNDMCARLKSIGFDGPCSIELFRPEYWEWDPKLVATTAHKAALKVLSPFFHID
jgi:2-keto-myo-inositol isomerase